MAFFKQRRWLKIKAQPKVSVPKVTTKKKKS